MGRADERARPATRGGATARVGRAGAPVPEGGRGTADRRGWEVQRDAGNLVARRDGAGHPTRTEVPNHADPPGSASAHRVAALAPPPRRTRRPCHRAHRPGSSALADAAADAVGQVARIVVRAARRPGHPERESRSLVDGRDRSVRSDAGPVGLGAFHPDRDAADRRPRAGRAHRADRGSRVGRAHRAARTDRGARGVPACDRPGAGPSAGQPSSALPLLRQRWPSRVSSTITPRPASSSRRRSEAVQS